MNVSKNLSGFLKGGIPFIFFLILSTVSVFALFNTEYIIIQPQAENNLYGGMWYHNNTPTSLNFVDGVYFSLFFTEPNHLNGFIFNGSFGTASNLTTLYNGTYLINYMVIGSGQNNHIYLTSIFINSINKYNCETHKKMAAGGDVITQTGTCLLDISAGEVISLRTVDISGGGSGDYYGGNLDIIQVGD